MTTTSPIPQRRIVLEAQFDAARTQHDIDRAALAAAVDGSTVAQKTLVDAQAAEVSSHAALKTAEEALKAELDDETA